MPLVLWILDITRNNITLFIRIPILTILLWKSEKKVLQRGTNSDDRWPVHDVRELLFSFEFFIKLHYYNRIYYIILCGRDRR